MLRRSFALGLGAALLAALLVACGDGDEGTIEVSASDDFRFDPGAVTVQSGEEVTFVVTNQGEIVHEFVLGPEHVQMAHEEAMDMGEEHQGMEFEGQLASIDLEPGETMEVTVTFDEPGQIIFGCHEPGHYEAGMLGTVTVE